MASRVAGNRGCYQFSVTFRVAPRVAKAQCCQAFGCRTLPIQRPSAPTRRWFGNASLVSSSACRAPENPPAGPESGRPCFNFSDGRGRFAGKRSESRVFRPRTGIASAQPDSTGNPYRDSYIGHGCKFSVEKPVSRFDFSVETALRRFDFSDRGDSISARVSKGFVGAVAESAWKNPGRLWATGANPWSHRGIRR